MAYDLNKCPECGYVNNKQPDICPNCGCNLEEYRAKIRAQMWEEAQQIAEKERNEKLEETYKNAIRSCDARELVKIIKTIYLRKKERVAEGKKMTYSDEKYYRLAEGNLYGEVAVSLSMTKEEAKEFVERKVEEV